MIAYPYIEAFIDGRWQLQTTVPVVTRLPEIPPAFFAREVPLDLSAALSISSIATATLCAEADLGELYERVWPNFDGAWGDAVDAMGKIRKQYGLNARHVRLVVWFEKEGA